MSNLRLFDPSFNDSFETALRRFFAPAGMDKEAAALQMRIDVSEKDNQYLVKADIPGVKKEDINVRIDGDLVQIDAEVKKENERQDEAGKLLRSERYYGSISRSFSLGQEVDADQTQARYADGVLTLELPKKSPGATRKVAVQ